MTIVTVAGDPEALCTFLNSVIGSGNDITLLQKTKNNSTYIVGYESSGPVLNSYILKEDGSFLLLESGDKIILQ